MTDKMIAQTLHEHNILRAKFARGEVEGYPGKVKRMSKLVSLNEFVSETRKILGFFLIRTTFHFNFTFEALGPRASLLC